MSGTSLDGIDCAFVKITLTYDQPLETYPSCIAQMTTAQTIPYPKVWKDTLANAHHLSKAELQTLNQRYTKYLATTVRGFIRANQLKDIDYVCSHGHTVLHNPTEGYTLQIGNLPKIARDINLRVVCDFRTQDVAMGGQGAPLVPIGDALLFKDYDYCLNLGGFANVSTDLGGRRVAYDICPVNVVLNTYAQRLGKEYDASGAFARSGVIHTELLSDLNALPFYHKKAPKSLGIEWVDQYVFPLLEGYMLSSEDVLATYTKHVATQLLSQFKEGARVLITGGGAYNEYLMELLRFRESIHLTLPNPTLIEFKEALIFGLLGVLKVEGLPNCLASVTGARADHCSGVIYES